MTRFYHCISRLAALAVIVASAVPSHAQDAAKLQRIQNLVVIYAENHSFDNLYGLFPGANGIANATPEQMTQVDHSGKALPELLVFGQDGRPKTDYPRLPNRPFRIDAPPVSRSPSEIVPSPTHSYYHHIAQINGGKNNLFAAVSAVGGWTMGYYDGSQFKLWQWAKEYTLADNFFQAAFGGSFLNHQWLICACTPRHWNAPDSMRTSAKAPAPFLDRQVTSDGWSVNTSQPPYQPSGITPKVDGPLTHAAADNRPAVLLQQPTPPQTRKTIGDTLSAKGVSWAWYAGAWNAALADGQQPPSARRRVIYNRQEGAANFQPHHQPFNYFANFAPGKAARTQHLKDGDDFLAHIDAGTLPAVAFYKPAGRYTQHPAYTDIISGDAHIAALLDKLRASRQWQDMLVIVTYDENGGYWDHVPPPTGPGWGDRWGPGSRVPTLLIGPHVKRGFVDKTAYDTTSIIKFITERFDLEPLPGVRAKVGDFSNALN